MRSTLDALGKSSLNLTVVNATLNVKALTEKHYEHFATECTSMTVLVGGFLGKAHSACADADTCDASSDDEKLTNLVGDIKKLTFTAEHHKIGADSARTRYNAMMNVAPK